MTRRDRAITLELCRGSAGAGEKPFPFGNESHQTRERVLERYLSGECRVGDGQTMIVRLGQVAWMSPVGWHVARAGALIVRPSDVRIGRGHYVFPFRTLPGGSLICLIRR